MDTIVDKLKALIPSVSKAVAGALVSATVVLLLKYNIVLPEEVNAALRVVLDFTVALILGGLAVYFAPKNKAK